MLKRYIRIYFVLVVPITYISIIRIVEYILISSICIISQISQWQLVVNDIIKEFFWFLHMTTSCMDLTHFDFFMTESNKSVILIHWLNLFAFVKFNQYACILQYLLFFISLYDCRIWFPYVSYFDIACGDGPSMWIF